MRRKVAPGVWEEMGPGSATAGHAPAVAMSGARNIGHMEPTTIAGPMYTTARTHRPAAKRP